MSTCTHPKMAYMQTLKKKKQALNKLNLFEVIFLPVKQNIELIKGEQQNTKSRFNNEKFIMCTIQLKNC